VVVPVNCLGWDGALSPRLRIVGPGFKAPTLMTAPDHVVGMH
jgi:hypothetical protein